MADVRIDRLTLRLTGFAGPDARCLAERVAEGLAAATLPVSLARRLGALRLSVEVRPGTDVDQLAREVVAELLRRLQQSL